MERRSFLPSLPLLLLFLHCSLACDLSISLEEPCLNDSDISNTCVSYKKVPASYEKQFLTSPGYPIGYPDNSVCRWLIYNPIKEGNGSSDNVVLKFVDMDMEPSGSCTKDFVEFRDGFRIWNLVLGRHCDKKCTNENKTITINSTSGRVLVTFQTDTPPPNGAFRGSADDKKLSKFRGFKICYYLKRAQKEVFKKLTWNIVNYIVIALFGVIVIPFAVAFVVLVYLDFKRSKRLRKLLDR